MTTLDRRIARNRLATWQWLGFAGSGLTALGGIVAGVGPAGDVPAPPGPGAATMWLTAVVYLGLTLLLLGWYGVGRAVAGPVPPSARDLIRTGLLWAVPFAISGPIFSRDVYSYLAQGAMTVAGLDPYLYGPSAFGGELAVNVPPIWQDTPAPYGPVFLSLAGAVTTATGQELWPGLIGMRLLAVAGIALIAVTVPRIAREYGVDPAAALWLGVLNPLVLLHLVADAHNEAVMLGLMCAGLLLALRDRPLAGAVLITLAGLVKGPALLALAFVAVRYAGRLTGRARLPRAGAAIVATGAVTALAVTALAGTGFGWIPALRTPTRALTWMSVTTDLGGLLGRALNGLGLATVSETRQVVCLVGLLAAGVLALVLLRRSPALGMVAALALSLIALVLLGPVVHVWYLLWGLVPLAAAGTARARRIAAYASPALVLVAPPNGMPTGVHLVLGGVLGVAVGLLAYGLLRGARRRAGTLEPVLDRL